MLAVCQHRIILGIQSSQELLRSALQFLQSLQTTKQLQESQQIFEEILWVSVRFTGWICIVKSIPWLLLSAGITVFDLGFSQFIGLP